MATQTQMMSLEDVTVELGISDLEARRSIAQCKLVASIINPDAIEGPKPQRPKYLVKRSDFEAFAGNLGGVRLRPNFIGKSGFFQLQDTKNRLGNALVAAVNEWDEATWLQIVRSEVERRGYRRPGLLKDLQLTLNSVPEEVSEAASQPLLNGFAGKLIRGNETLKRGIPAESLVMNLGHAVVVNKAIAAMRDELSDRYGRIKGVSLENVYWTKERYESLVAATRKRLVDSHLSIRSRAKQIEAEEGHYSFYWSAHVPMTSIVPRPTIVAIFETLF